MKEAIIAAAGGVLFAMGLAIGGMTNPHKVLAFLDFTGDWDPSLAFVMGGAILAYAPLYRVITRRDRPRVSERFHLPTRRDIDLKLLIGASLFGIGWGLGGFCPGPALVSAMSFGPSALTFTAAMLVGMGGFSLWQRNQGG